MPVIETPTKPAGSTPVDRPETVHIFSESVADRLRYMTYQFAAAIDEVLFRTRCVPPAGEQPAGQEAGFHDLRQELSRELAKIINHEQPR